MRFIINKLLTTTFSIGIFVLVASSASNRSVPSPAALAPTQITTVIQRRPLGADADSGTHFSGATVDRKSRSKLTIGK